jgi:hypothetical protein
MFFKSFHKTLGLGAAFIVAMSTAAMAQSGSRMDNQGSTITRQAWYVDFAATTIAGHSAEPTFSLGGANVKAHMLQVYNNGTNTAACFDVSTSAPDFIPAATADTRIWFWNANSNAYEVLNDDFGGGTFSAGRIYLVGSNAFVNLRVAAFSTAWNTAHFRINLTRNNITEASCTTGSGKKWVKHINGVMTNG